MTSNPVDPEYHVNKKDFLVSLVKQIKSGIPLLKIQLPMALIEPRSLIEYFSDRFLHLDILLRSVEIEDPEQRFLENLKFYLSGWHLIVKDVRHPFNPILGEVFKCNFKNKDELDGTTHFIAEQTSHHPPASAFCLYNEEKHVAINAFVKPNFGFSFRSNCVEVKLEGQMHSQSFTRKEEYFATLPILVIKGVILGSLSMDISGKAKYWCPQSKLVAEITFKTESMFGSSPNNSVIANVYHESKPSDVLYTIAGRWSEIIDITDHATDETTVFFDATAQLPLAEKIVSPVSQQAENESQRVWKGVKDNIQDEAVAQREKHAVENRQRALARERLESGKPHEIKNFVKNEKGEYFYRKQPIQSIGPSA